MANISSIIATGGSGMLAESDITLTDITTNNATVNNHGFCPKLSGSADDALKGDGSWGAVASSGGGDLLSTLVEAEVVVTTSATLTIGKMHVCSGVSADYTVTLPAAAGNAGKFVGVRMASGLTKLVTIDGNGSETIDGALTRVMWAGEAAILQCDGSNWLKIAGKSLPMIATLKTNGTYNQTPAASTATKLINMQNLVSCLDMLDAANNRITIKRPGTYKISRTAISWNSNTSNCAFQAYVRVDGAGYFANTVVAYIGSLAYYFSCDGTEIKTFTAGQYLEHYGEYSAGSFSTNFIYTNTWGIEEIPTW